MQEFFQSMNKAEMQTVAFMSDWHNKNLQKIKKDFLRTDLRYSDPIQIDMRITRPKYRCIKLKRTATLEADVDKQMY